MPFPDVTIPDPDRLLMVWRTSLGPDAGKGIVSPPPKLGARVPKSGVAGRRRWQRGRRHSAAAGCRAGRHLHRLEPARVGRLAAPARSCRCRARRCRSPPRARSASSGPIRASSIEERYRDRDDYRAKALAVAQKLAEQRYILERTSTLPSRSRWNATTPSPSLQWAVSGRQKEPSPQPSPRGRGSRWSTAPPLLLVGKGSGVRARRR